MDRHWLITSTTYGTWLPGDKRGFVSNVRVNAGPEQRHNVPQTEYDADMLGLRHAAECNLLGSPLYLNRQQAEQIIEQFRETAYHRNWEILGVAVMANHFHIVIGVMGDPDPDTILRDFKAYASRRLNKKWKRPKGDTWWTESGSCRKLPDAAAIRAAVEYVRNQSNPLAVWFPSGERGASAP